MTILNCSAMSCVHNEAGMCQAGYILIEGKNSTTTLETKCSSYKPNKFINQVRALVNTNYVGEVMQLFSSMDRVKMNPQINCQALNCFFNSSGKCESRNVAISVDKSDTTKVMCETFVK